MKRGMAVGLIIVGVLVVVVVAVAALTVVKYNAIVRAATAAETEKGQVEASLQRRLDLIPNLVETVKGYAEHEEAVLTAVVNARTRAFEALTTVSSDKSLTREGAKGLQQAQARLSSSVHRLIALVEDHPDLKASANFMALQDQLEGTENRINVARQRYNTSVGEYNSMIRMFPGNLVAAAFGHEEMVYFEAAKQAQTAPEADLRGTE
jgi:LemA protein